MTDAILIFFCGLLVLGVWAKFHYRRKEHGRRQIPKRMLMENWK